MIKFGNAATSSIVLKHDNHKCALMKQLDGVRYGGGGANAKAGVLSSPVYPIVLLIKILIIIGSQSQCGNGSSRTNSLDSEVK